MAESQKYKFLKFILSPGLAAAAVLECANTVSCLNPVLKPFFWYIVSKLVICHFKKKYMIDTTECYNHSN